MASRPKREGLLALRFFAPASLLPTLCSQSQLNRRIRALKPELRLLQLAFAEDLTEPSAVCGVMGHDPRPCHREGEGFSRMGLLAGQASFGCGASKTEWVYGLKVALVVDPDGVITAFFLALQPPMRGS